MSQSDFGVIDPNTKSGTQLAVDLNGFRDAVNSGHSGATRPAYLPAGGHWVRVVSSTRWDLVLYDGAVDYTLRSINPATGQKIGIPASDLADKQTSANDNTAGRLLVNPAYGLGTTGALSLPSGTTANRPASPAQFDSRGNSTTGAPEWWSGSAWVPFSGIDYLNSDRIDVASAATVNLTTGAPNTRHINITGTTTITGFTIAAGRCYFVRFNATLTLTNGAALVTQTGANITTAAGDTCILRATAANVVEVLAYTPCLNQAVGYGQTWQDVTGSRAPNTTYTNSTGKPILVWVGFTVVAGGTISYLINGVTIAYSASIDVGDILPVSFIVPNGATYRCNTTSTLNRWSELR